MRIDVVDGFHAEARMPECRGHCPIGSIACVNGACEAVSPANAEASTPAAPIGDGAVMWWASADRP